MVGMIADTRPLADEKINVLSLQPERLWKTTNLINLPAETGIHNWQANSMLEKAKKKRALCRQRSANFWRN
jgi:hypothetical protein